MSNLFRFLLRTKLIQLSLLGLGLVLLGFQLYSLVDSGILNQDDFVEYWAAGRLNLSGENPYDPQGLFTLQVEIWPDRKEPLMMWNPPWTLALVMPFGAIKYSTARILWLVFSFSLLLFCSDYFWRVFGGFPNQKWVAIMVSILFLPTIYTIMLGQISFLLVLSLSAFLYFHRVGKMFLAGAASSLLTVKPHLIYLFFIALIFWSIQKKQWAVIGGFVSAILSTCILVLAINPQIFHQYIYSAMNFRPTIWMTPTLGSLLREIIGSQKSWLLYLPNLIGFIWFIFYWKNNTQTWNWNQQIPVLIIASMVSTSFAWSWDRIVFIILIIEVASIFLRSTDSKNKYLILIAHIIIQVFGMMIYLWGFSDFWTWWMTPSFAGLYLYARNNLRSERGFTLPA